ncbi:hypothetical protein M513_07022, partial [Trichuris suis]
MSTMRVKCGDEELPTRYEHNFIQPTAHLNEATTQMYRQCVSNRLNQNECEMDRRVLVQSGHTKCSPENKTLPNVQWETAYMNVSSNMCKNNSTCVNTFGSFMCVCEDGWQGEFCDEDIDECKDELSKCHPDFGLCANTLGSYRCECFQKNMDQYCNPRNGAPSSQGIYALALAVMKAANTLFLAITSISLSVIAMRQDDMKRSIVELLTFIHNKGHRMTPNIGIAAFPASSYRYLYPLEQCENTYPHGQPLAWMLFPSDTINEFKVFMDKLNPRRYSKTDCRPQAWCSLHSSSIHNEDGDLHYKDLQHEDLQHEGYDETDDLPTIVNGRLIVGINKTSDETLYHVVYHDYASKITNSTLHHVSNESTISSYDGVLFRNLSVLREVYQKWRPFLHGPLLINYSSRNGIFYTSLTGKPMHTTRQEGDYKAMVCQHDGIREKCKKVKKQNVFGSPSDYCDQCNDHLYGRHCQFDPDECSSGDGVHEFGFFYVDCKEYVKKGTVLFAQAVVVASLRHNCSEHGTCMNTFGSYFCFCENGWTGEFCETDIDECEESLDNCDNKTAPCKNTPGSYKCAPITGLIDENYDI